MFFDMFSRAGMNTELIVHETQPYLTGEEKRALRRAEKAEEAFRASKGYAPRGLRARIRRWLHL
ncbi:MAG: hypothetical protein ACOX67_04650 [Oscillospiraceae bacterium]|jgi:hypothetical protein